MVFSLSFAADLGCASRFEKRTNYETGDCRLTLRAIIRSATRSRRSRPGSRKAIAPTHAARRIWRRCWGVQRQLFCPVGDNWVGRFLVMACRRGDRPTTVRTAGHPRAAALAPAGGEGGVVAVALGIEFEDGGVVHPRRSIAATVIAGSGKIWFHSLKG